ncbi:MAG TPA: hypothetical protein VLN58_02250 [Verrucomicrobiae bacterium]|nr:hypothetical protein [Verrucomicrobiae bacterium]
MTTTIQLVQNAYNSVCRYQTKSCQATFEDPTLPGSLVIATAVIGGGACDVQISDPGFVLVRSTAYGRVHLYMWYYQNAPTMNSITVSARDDRSIQLRVMEYSGASQSNALDQVVVRTSYSNRCDSGQTGITVQADEIVVACVANAYTGCTQSGFSGGLVRLFEALSPYSYANRIYNDDSDRTRWTHHHLIASIRTYFNISCWLSSYRDWIAIVATFRGGSSGPKQLTSKAGTATTQTGGKSTGILTAFGPLQSKANPAVTKCGSGQQATILPFNYQYWIGPNRFLIGSGTQFHVQGTSGLGGHSVRTSDQDFPRADGSLRGVDLGSARVVTFEMNVGKGRDVVELNMNLLYRALVPQRNEDWQLVWRHPDDVARMMYVRPTDLVRERNNKQITFANQKFALRAADPRHYSAVPHHIIIPNSPVSGVPNLVNITNVGNIAAYPVITVYGPTSGPTVSRVTLTNITSQVAFDVSLNIPKGSTLVGDMQSRITGAPRSVITLDGQSKYGAWALPREPFRIDADPTGQEGYNQIYLQTVPAGAPVLCTLDYRDTWAG